MKLTHKLLDLLNRVFDKEPHAFVAFRVRRAGGLTWSVADGTLTLTYDAVDHVYNLSAYTLQSLAAALVALSGFEVTAMTTRSSLSALVLLDGCGDESASNGDALLGYTSLLWAFVEAWARELQTLREAVDQALLQMSTTTASGAWLDEIGSYYAVPRTVGESDALYGQRIIAQTLRPISNNLAIEVAIEDYTGQACKVEDVVIYRGVFPIYDGTIHYDGAHDYDTVGLPNYGLFDVTTAYDLILGGDISGFHDAVVAIVEKLRASGTHLRALALGSAAPLTDAFTAPHDSTSGWIGAMGYSEALTAPTEAATGYTGRLTDIVEAASAPAESQTGNVFVVVRTAGGQVLTTSAGDPILAAIGPLFV